MKKEDKEKLMNEVLNKRREVNKIGDDTISLLTSLEAELDELLKKNQEDAKKIQNELGLSEDYIKGVEKEIASDFNLQEKQAVEVVRGKDSKEVFDKMAEEVKVNVLGQDEAVDAILRAVRRPYVTGFDAKKLKNSMIITGSDGSGKHYLMQEIAKALKNNNLSLTPDLAYLDMSRYQNSSSETLFLQDFYAALEGPCEFIVIENFAVSSPVYNRMLSEMVINNKIVLSKRYSLKNGQLEEVTTKLTGDIIDTLYGNSKYLVFINEGKESSLLDYFGKNFIDAIHDKVKVKTFEGEVVDQLIQRELELLEKKCEAQLEIDLVIDPTINQDIKDKYEKIRGIKSIREPINRIYNDLVNLALAKDIDVVTVKEEADKLIAVYGDEIMSLSDDDANKEREEIQKELDAIVGLDQVKEYLLSLEDLLKINTLRKQKGMKTAEVSKHMVFTGNPGTGKTTIARIVSRLMKACGILKTGQLVEVTRSDLVGRYVGHTAPLTASVIESAIGGVLFIDEAYSLYRGHDDSFGLEAIDTLVKMMEDHRDDLIVILAGYSREMAEFLEANSGLKSRFANIIHFPDYTGEELAKIAVSIATGKDYKIDDDAYQKLIVYFTKVQAKGDATSGNGRLARNVVEDAILKQSQRILSDPDKPMDLLLTEDFVELNDIELPKE